ncbi:TPA: hypothetical protein QIW90_005444 [Klebsiella variicola]|nr:hypothetical protein C4Y83_010330 [Klebsiella pneumoniae subsp. pneumoniae]HBR2375750.1 hypothetical protein [Klebsiella pneumoniae]HDU3540723.1 hypothetical protein [Klebsiella variicola]HBX7619819.1 hypothetical protein [Klebsiella pneumoniae]HCJ4706073.1 hypothetical protein [Klebsiella pneumoniae]
MQQSPFDEMKRVSGAGHFGDVRDANMGKSNKNTGSNNKGNTGYYNNLGQDVTNCNNGIIGGMIAGAPGGVLGLGTGLVGGALAGGCFSHGNGNGGGSGKSSGSNCGSGVGGTCK